MAHPKKKRIRPLQQGALDGFCGIYSLFNAARIVEPNLTESSCHALFATCLTALEDRKDVPFINIAGLTLGDLLFLNRQVFRPAFGIRHVRPFVKAKPRSRGQVWRFFSEVLAEPHTAIVMSFTSEDWAHWTVVQDIDDEALWLADSDGMRNILRKEASIVKVSTQRPLCIQWRDVFVVRRLAADDD